MAYGLKYTASFINYFNKQVVINISKRDYEGSYTQMRVKEASIESNFKDENTSIIGTGAKIVIMADANNFSTYEDLLTSGEKEFKCEIKYNETPSQIIPPEDIYASAPSNIGFIPDNIGTDPHDIWIKVFEVSDTERSLPSSDYSVTIGNSTEELWFASDSPSWGTNILVFIGNSINNYFVCYELTSGIFVNLFTLSGSGIVYNDVLNMPVRRLNEDSDPIIESSGDLSSLTVFTGFSMCDLNERQLLPYAQLTLQFVDYLSRLDGINLTSLLSISGKSTIYDIITEIANTIALGRPLYVNSSVFETRMNNGITDTFIEQTFVENVLFYTDSVNYENAEEVINKILFPFGAYLYSLQNSWVIERLEDVTRSDNWVVFEDTTASSSNALSVASLKQTIHKQNHDFEYYNETQVIEYASGLHTLILNLRDKQYDSFVFNDYDPATMIPTNEQWPTSGSLTLKQWYYYNQIIGITKGYNYLDMSSYLRWRNPANSSPENFGIYNSFEVQFDTSDDNPTSLDISFKMATDDAILTAVSNIVLRFSIKIVGGDYDNQYLYITNAGSIGITTNVSHFEEVFHREPTEKTKVWSMSYSLDLTSPTIELLLNGEPNVLDSFWDLIYKPESIGFIIMFWPIKLTDFIGSNSEVYAITETNYLGDVAVTVTQRDVPNKYTYSVNEDFIKTEELDVDVFDLKNKNFCNGMLIEYTTSNPFEDNNPKSNLWISRNEIFGASILDIFAKTKFRNYYQTMHRLKGTILYDGYLKPFTIINDNNLSNNLSGTLNLLLQNYTWDLDKGTYDIIAQEYTDEEIIINKPITESWDLSEIIPEPLQPPSQVIATQQGSGGYVIVEWSQVSGATGYRVRRSPYWYVTGYWAQDYKEIYVGSSLEFDDHIELEGTPENGMQVNYIVSAYNDNESSIYSDAVSILYVASGSET